MRLLHVLHAISQTSFRLTDVYEVNVYRKTVAMMQLMIIFSVNRSANYFLDQLINC